MLHQFSKIFLALFIFAGIFSSCNKDKDPEPDVIVTPIDTVVTPPVDTTGTDTVVTPDPIPEPTAIIVLGTDFMITRQPNLVIKTYSLQNSKIRTAPTHGEKQVWDLREYILPNAEIQTDDKFRPVPAGTSFTTATFITTQQSEFSSDFTFSEFFEASENGYYRLGVKIDAGTANLGNGTLLTATGNEDAITPKDLIFKFPMNYNTVNDNVGVLKEKYSLTAPAFGLTNAPVERKLTYTVKSEVVGWGKVILPQGGITDSTEVLLVKNTETTLSNYFLNGSRAPDVLLNSLNLKENEKITFIFYRFMSKQFGIVASFGFDTNSSGTIKFPATASSYTISRE
jgi:hypothetical protein